MKYRSLVTSAVIVLGILATATRADEAPEMSGAELYRTFCASCHGMQARGDGPVANDLNVTVPDLTLIAARSGGTFRRDAVREQIDGQRTSRAHGSRDMPVWGWELYAVKAEDTARRQRVAELIERVVGYLESIQRK